MSTARRAVPAPALAAGAAAVAGVLVGVFGGAIAARAAPPGVLHDAVVVPPRPLRVRLPAGDGAVTERVRVKVVNADPAGGQIIRLEVESIDCPGVTLARSPDFGRAAAATSDSVALAAGRSAVARVFLALAATAFEPSLALDPHRCTVALRARTIAPEGARDAAPANNVSTLEIDVHRPGGTAGPDGGWAVRSLRPLVLTPSRGAAGATSRVAVRVANVDAAVGPGYPGQAITVTASDGDCPPGTVGAPDFDRSAALAQADRTVRPQRTATAAVPIAVDLRMLALGRPGAPARCTALIGVRGGVGRGDRDASNDVSRLVLDAAAAIDPGSSASAIEIVAPANRSQAPADGSVPVVVRLASAMRQSPRVLLSTGLPPRVSDLSGRLERAGDLLLGGVTASDLLPGPSLLVVSSGARSASVLFSWEPGIDVSLAERCEVLGQARCLLPFPSDRFTVADEATDTGRRVRLVAASMPANVSGVHVDPTELNRNDGFSPATAILAHVPGVDLARSGAAPITDIGRSLDDDAPIACSSELPHGLYLISSSRSWRVRGV